MHIKRTAAFLSLLLVPSEMQTSAHSGPSPYTFSEFRCKWDYTNIWHGLPLEKRPECRSFFFLMTFERDNIHKRMNTLAHTNTHTLMPGIYIFLHRQNNTRLKKKISCGNDRINQNSLNPEKPLILKQNWFWYGCDTVLVDARSEPHLFLPLPLSGKQPGATASEGRPCPTLPSQSHCWSQEQGAWIWTNWTRAARWFHNRKSLQDVTLKLRAQQSHTGAQRE